jgi:hypothetical protein
MNRLTYEQRQPFTFTITVDEATALSIAVHSNRYPAQYAAGLLIKVCKTAAALGTTPHEVPMAAVMSHVSFAANRK